MISQVNICLIKTSKITSFECKNYLMDSFEYSLPYLFNDVHRSLNSKLKIDFNYKKDNQELCQLNIALHWNPLFYPLKINDPQYLTDINEFWNYAGYDEYARILKYDDLLIFLLFILRGNARTYFIEQFKNLLNCNDIIIDIADYQSKVLDQIYYNNFFQKYFSSEDYKEKIDLFISGERGILIG